MAATDRIQLRSGTLHVESTGDRNGRVVLCVHGLSANCRSFDRLAPALAEQGRHVVAMDLRGRGRSDITPVGSYGWDTHVRDLLEIAGHFGAESFDVVGHSMGAFIGMSLAAQHPDRCGRLVLLDGVGAPEPEALRSIASSVSRLGQTYPSAAAAVSYIRAAGTIVSWDSFWDSYFAWELEQADDGGVRVRTDPVAVAEDSAYASTHDVSELWAHLQCPVQLLRATRPMAPAGGLVVTRADADRFVTDARTVVEIDADHYSILTSAPAIDAVSHFLGP